MSIFVRMKRSVIVAAAALAVITGVLVNGGPATAQTAAGDTTLGDVTGFSADKATYTLSAGAAKVRVVFLKDDVFRLWLAPDGNFTDPAGYAAHRSERPGVEHRHQDRLRHPADGLAGPRHLLLAHDRQGRGPRAEVAAEVLPVPDERPAGLGRDRSAVLERHSTTQSLGRGPNEQFFGGGMQNGRFSHRDQTIKISADFNWEDGGNPNASPYYMSTAGYGVLRNTFSPGSYSFTSPVSPRTTSSGSTRTTSSATSRPRWTATPSSPAGRSCRRSTDSSTATPTATTAVTTGRTRIPATTGRSTRTR